MQKKEAEKHLRKKVRIVLSNGFHFSGEVLEVSEDTFILLDKFGARVSIKLSDIMVCSEVTNGY